MDENSIAILLAALGLIVLALVVFYFWRSRKNNGHGVAWDTADRVDAPPAAAREADAPSSPNTTAPEAEPLHAPEPPAETAGPWVTPADDAKARDRDHPPTVDPNTASEEELAALPGAGTVIAGRIVEHREKHGPFQSREDLMAVQGIGEKTVEQLWPHVDIDSTEDGVPASRRER